MNILFTICGRAGSKGLKNKNLKTLYGKPLVGYALSLVDLFSKKRNDNVYIAINTDSQELSQVVSNINKNVYKITRKPELATDSIGKVEVIKDTYLEMKKKIDGIDLVVDLDITSPLRTVEDLEKVIDTHTNSSDYDVIFSVVPSRRNPYFNMVKQEDGKTSLVIQSKFTARQQAPQVYDMNASIYSYKTDFLENNSYIFSGNCGLSIMDDYLILDIDSEEDFEWLEHIYPYLLKKRTALQEVFNNI